MRRRLQQAGAKGLASPWMARASEAELVVSGLSHHWPSGQRALNHCNLNIPGPGLWMLVGSNGSGKSTLFRLIAGLLEPQTGVIQRRHKAALVFQNPDHQLLLPSCGSDLMLGMNAQQPQQGRQRRANELLDQIGLSGLINRPIHTLSGGQKQRLAIAGALASDAGLLLLDEPTALLDPDSQRTVLEAVSSLCNDTEDPITALWITHRLEELDQAKGAAQMTNGCIGAWTSGKTLRHHLQAGRSAG